MECQTYILIPFLNMGDLTYLLLEVAVWLRTPIAGV